MGLDRILLSVRSRALSLTPPGAELYPRRLEGTLALLDRLGPSAPPWSRWDRLASGWPDNAGSRNR